MAPNISESSTHKMAARKTAGIDMERNYVTVILCIRREQLMSSTDVERRTVRPNFSLNFPFYRVTLCIAVMECIRGCQSDCENVLYLLLCV